MNDNIRIPLAEAIGTAVLVIGGPGTAIFATGGFNEGLSVGILGVSLAFGLSLLCMAYLIGRISGCHINPAVTIGMIVAKKLDAAKSAPYFVGQFVGGIVGAGIIALTLSGTDGYMSKAQDAGFASNGFGEHSPAGFDLLSVAIIEIVLTAVFVLIVLGTTTTKCVPTGFGPVEHLGQPGSFARHRRVPGRLGARPGLGLHPVSRDRRRARRSIVDGDRRARDHRWRVPLIR